jgi:hypothetical protein
MKTASKKFGVYAVVLGVAGVWLAWDKLGGGGPQAAAAAETPAAAVSGDSATVASATDNTQAVVMASVAQRLAEVCKARGVDVTKIDGLRDAFRPSAAWMPRQAAAPAGPTFDVNAFKSQHKLTVVLTGARGGQAVIDGRRLQVGEDGGGFKLVTVRKTSAVVSVSGRLVELPIESALGR